VQANGGQRRLFTRPEAFDPALRLVVGQESAKRKLQSAFSQYTRFLESPQVARPSIMVYGPSGTGKTMMVERLAKTCELPYTILSGAGISVTSYKGKTLREVLIQHWQRWKKDYGVIFIDEIDKWCTGAIGKDEEMRSIGLKLQAELLRMIEAEVVTFEDEGMDIPEIKDLRFHTDRILWIVAGAFVNLETVTRRRLQNPTLRGWEEIWKHVLPNDFETYGLLNELKNRIQTWVWVLPLTRIQIIQILKDQAVPAWVALFKSIDCELLIEESALAWCANTAYEMRVGARGSMSLLRRTMEDIYYEASTHRAPRVVVDQGAVRTGVIEFETA
jgi:ATP-dependent protease Clp ATPase subunit